MEKKYLKGEVIQGKIIRHAPFGVFVDIGDINIEGFIPTIDFGIEYYDKFHLDHDNGNHDIINDAIPSYYPEIGFEMPLKITGFNEKTIDNKQQLWLSVRVNEMPAIDWSLTKKTYPKGSKVFGEVVRHTNLGVYINIEDDPLEGFIPSFCFGKEHPFKNYPYIGTRKLFEIVNYSIDLEGRKEQNQIFLK
ncbi:S1 RNA-binding domain-containing protein [Flammeovirga aprica]|uniref:S1 RNA-binding domain-containing protein n=1 Tax=Flammeovirga aprica JL-4 TaxID=694437 RepID=A0A7X9RWM7_9BACT|nr:S1 RNA-binding domain-containing protein [Flammeovirga aprica]NME70072.1 S1 RNA-binding domain-containing protein [Flammeovirga aprica JL-4]